MLYLDVITNNGSIPRQFEIKRVVNIGYAGRNREAVTMHVEELRREGIKSPSSLPMIIPVLSHNVTTQNEIEVIGSETSGEVEFVLLLDGEDVFVSVGSDHTDRATERKAIITSKQVCQNILSRKVWKFKDVESVWDELLLQSWVKVDEEDEEILYQKALLKTIIPPAELMYLVKSKINDGKVDGLVIFSGTIPILTDKTCYSSYFRGELIDIRFDRKLMCEYKIRKLDYLKDSEYI